MATEIRYALIHEDAQHRAFLLSYLNWFRLNNQILITEIPWKNAGDMGTTPKPRPTLEKCYDALRLHRANLIVIIRDCDAGYEKYEERKQDFRQLLSKSPRTLDQCVIAVPVRTIEAWITQAQSMVSGKQMRSEEVEEVTGDVLKKKLYKGQIKKERFEIIISLLEGFDFKQITCKSFTDFNSDFQAVVSSLP